MRFQLDPTSPSGLSVATPPVVQNRRNQANGYVTDNISGLLTAGSNVTITGNGTKANPYSIASSGAGGAGDHLTAADGTTITANTQASNFGAGISINPGSGTDGFVEAAHGLNLYAAAASDGSGAFSPGIQLSDFGNIIISTDNPATAGSNAIQLKATDGIGFTTNGTQTAFFDPSILTSNQTYTFPDKTGTLALTSDLPHITVASVAPSSPSVNDLWVDTS